MVNPCWVKIFLLYPCLCQFKVCLDFIICFIHIIYYITIYNIVLVYIRDCPR